MAFSEAQYQAAMDKLDSGAKDIENKLQKVGPTAEATANHWYVPGFVADALIWLANKIIEIGSWILNKIIELLKGAIAPILFFKYAWDWQDIRGMATSITGDLSPKALGVDRQWKGTASDAYVGAIKPQTDATTRIGTIADKTATSLTVCAAAGLVFYVALGVIVVKFIAALITAIAALGSVVFSWAGAGLIAEEAGVNTGLIIAAVSALTALLGAQASQMSVLHGEATDGGMFPGGHWPNATTNDFSDGTVTDGTANWSIQQ